MKPDTAPAHTVCKRALGLGLPYNVIYTFYKDEEIVSFYLIISETTGLSLRMLFFFDFIFCPNGYRNKHFFTNEPFFVKLGIS